jgi:hypothetical protein
MAASQEYEGRPKLAADPSVTVPAMPRQVHMEMVVVIGVGIWAKHGCKGIAGALVYLTQEGALARISGPTVFDCDLPPISKNKGRHVEGVGVAVF